MFLDPVAVFSKKRVRKRRSISIPAVAQDTGVSSETLRRLDDDSILEFPESVLVALCQYLECPLAGPEGLIELIDVSEAEVSEKRKIARQRLVERKQRRDARDM
jgi:DNA-binding Xre family transcriptional regulator